MERILSEQLIAMAMRARSAYHAALEVDDTLRAAALRNIAEALRSNTARIEDANSHDIATAKKNGLSDAMCDRLLLTRERVLGLVKAVTQIAQAPGVLGHSEEAWDVASNGLHIERISIPIGVIGMIYEARPGVTVDAAALCIKSGNAVILRGGSESFHTNQLLAELLADALEASVLPRHLVQMVATTERAAVDAMLTLSGHIDVLIPRGGKSLTEKVARDARMPTMLHLTGNCHSYVHHSADMAKAVDVIVNAKMRRVSVCGATESLLIDEHAAPHIVPALVDALSAAGCSIKGCEKSQGLDARITPASENDWGTEYLAAVVSVKIVSGVEEAITHINQYGSHHTDAILAEDARAIRRFTQAVDSAIVMVNASTQFADGGEFGFGGEIGIATGRMPPRGPVAARQLTTYKYVVRGNHATRP